MRIMYLRHSPRSEQDAQDEAAVLERVRTYVSAGTELEMHYPDDFPGAAVKDAMAAQGVLNGLYHALKAPRLVRKAVEAEQSGFDAVVQGNSFDPAIEASRLAVSIPVVGTLKTSLHVVATLADRVGFTVPFGGHIPLVRAKIEGYGMSRIVAGIRAMGVYKGTSEATVLDHAAANAQELIDQDGAEFIVPLGGALIPHRVTPHELAQRIGVPVLNTVGTTLRMAELYAALGIAHSPLTYPRAELAPDLFDRTLTGAPS